jgi:lipoate-protein ligase A
MTQQTKPVRLLNLGPTQWLRTQSVYRATATLISQDSPGSVVISTPLHGYVAVGGGQQPETTVDLKICTRSDLPVVSSPLSAPITYLDSGALISQWVFHQRDPQELAGLMLDGFAGALESLGIARISRGGSQIAVRDRILIQTQTGMLGPAGVVQGEIFLMFDGCAAEQVLNEKARTYLWREMPRPFSPDMLEAALLQAFSATLGRSIERGTPTQAETRLSKQIDLELLEQAAHLSGTEVVLDAEH